MLVMIKAYNSWVSQTFFPIQLENLAFQVTKISKIGKLRKVITIKLGKVLW